MEALVGHSAAMKEMAQSLENRAKEHQQKVQDEFHKSVEKLTEVSSKAIAENVKATGAYFNVLQEGLGGLNKVLKDLGEKQVVIQQKKKGWFGS